MEISALTPKTLPGLTPMPSSVQTAAKGKIASPEDAKIADSCKQFESMLWQYAGKGPAAHDESRNARSR